MTRNSIFRLSASPRRVRRTAEPSPAGIAAGFLGMLVKLAQGSDRLAAARPRRPRS